MERLKKIVANLNLPFFQKLEEESKSCDTIRNKIREFLALKSVTQAHFLKMLGNVSYHSFKHFMALQGPDSGKQSHAYERCLVFFAGYEEGLKVAKKQFNENENENRKRSLSEITNETEQTVEHSGVFDTIEPPEKAQKTQHQSSSSSSFIPGEDSSSKRLSNDELTSITAINLEDQHVYDDCDEIRFKIHSFILEQYLTLTRFAKIINISHQPVAKFMALSGWNKGNSRIIMVTYPL